MCSQGPRIDVIEPENIKNLVWLREQAAVHTLAPFLLHELEAAA